MRRLVFCKTLINNKNQGEMKNGREKQFYSAFGMLSTFFSLLLLLCNVHLYHLQQRLGSLYKFNFTDTCRWSCCHLGFPVNSLPRPYRISLQFRFRSHFQCPKNRRSHVIHKWKKFHNTPKKRKRISNAIKCQEKKILEVECVLCEQRLESFEQQQKHCWNHQRCR